MPAKTKVVSHAAKNLRAAMVESLKRAIAANYPGIADWPAYKKIERATGVSASSLQRITSGDTGPSIDTLADLAHHLGISVHEMLEPRKDALPTAPGQETPAAAQRLQRRRRQAARNQPVG